MNVDVEYDVAWDQIQGKRESQQDCAVWVQIKPTQYLLVLADGLGGAVAGDVASSVAVRSFCEAYEMPSMPEEPGARLMAALQAANYAVHDRVVDEPDLAGMGTTLVAAVVNGYQLHWVSVGDSPMWLFRKGATRRLNANHSVAGVLAEQIAAGEITATEDELAPGRSQLLEAVQGQDIQFVDTPEIPEMLKPGDVVMLASDGVESCSLTELAEAVASDDNAEGLVRRILAAVEARECTSQDNATLIAFRLSPLTTDECDQR